MKHLNLTSEQQELINEGKFNPFKIKDRRFHKLKRKLSEDVPHARELGRLLKRAFIFNDEEMIEEIDRMITEYTRKSES